MVLHTTFRGVPYQQGNSTPWPGHWVGHRMERSPRTAAGQQRQPHTHLQPGAADSAAFETTHQNAPGAAIFGLARGYPGLVGLCVLGRLRHFPNAKNPAQGPGG